MLKVGLIFNYWSNKAEIIAECCINKNKPELKCEGKCFIGSQLNKIDGETKEDLPVKILEKDFELFFTPGVEYTVQTLPALQAFPTCFIASPLSEYHSRIFQPPTV